MLVSIIILAYNTEKYIGKCLNSVINQTYKNIEIIIINDASTDSTLDIINQYCAKDNRIILINQSINDSGIHFEDIIFSAKLFYHINSIAKLEVPVYHYNLRLGSIVRSWTVKTINDRLTAILSVKDMLKSYNDFERFRDCYTYFFVNSALVSSFIDYAQMDKHNAEIEDYFKELSKQPFIRQFPNIKLDLPQSFTNKREGKAYNDLKRTTYSILHHFSWTLFWLRSWIKLSNLFHPYSEAA